MVAHQKSLIVFAGAFPFEHAGGGSSLVTHTRSRAGHEFTIIFSLLSLFSRVLYYYLFPPPSVVYVVLLCGGKVFSRGCASQVPLDDAITMAPLRFWDSGSHGQST
jgi:hypothetical protein